jgi:hypothetical protein
MNSPSPSDEELLEAVIKLRQLHPHLARAKLRSLLKDDYFWTLSEKRLKKCLQENNLNAKPENESANLAKKPGNGSVDLPRDHAFQLILKDAFNDFKIRERNFLLALSQSQSLKATDGRIPDSMYSASHQRHHIEVLLVLKEIKPCALIVHGMAQDIFTEMVEKCLKPVIEKHQLEKYGFHLQQILHAMPTTTHVGFQNGWIFADTRSPLWPEVKYLFLTANTEKAEEKRIGVALGYPAPHGTAKVSAVDCTEMNDMRKATGRDVCCVTAFNFTCDPSSTHYRHILVHYHRCQSALKDVGTNIKLDLGEHRGLAKWMAQ